MKRPACFQRQTGACRRCGLAVSQLCRGHEEPVEATDLSATGRRTPTDQVRTKHRARSVPGVQRQERSTPTARLMSSGMKRSTPTRRTGVQRAKDQRQTPTAGLGPRTESYVKSAGSIRAACEGPTSTPLSAAVPSWETGGERIILRWYPCNRDHAPRFLWSETLEKPNSAIIINVPRPAEEGLRSPFARLPPNRSQNFTGNPSHWPSCYRHNSPKVRRRRSSRFLSALRVSKSAV